MSAHDDDLTTDLTRELHGRVDAMHGSALGLGDVQRKARSIRRRRTAAAVVGAAAAVALIVPTAALATHSDHRIEPAPATQSPSPTQTTTTADGHQPAPGVLDVADLPTGADAGIAYAVNGDIHFPDGSQLNVGTAHGSLEAFASLTDHTVVQSWRDSQGVSRIYVRTSDGTTYGPYPGSGDVAVNDADTLAAWVRPDGQVLVWTGATQPLALGDPLPSPATLRVTTVVGDACGPGTTGCGVYVNVSQGASPWQPWEANDSGSQRVRDGSFLTIADQSASGLTIGYTQITDSGSCSKLSGGGEFQGWSTCTYQPSSFSPDGRLVFAYPPYYDGPGASSFAMLESGTGKVLFHRASDAKTQAFITLQQWEDRTHALAPIYQDGTWALVRIGTDGSMEYAVPPAKGPMERSPFVLATSP